MWEIDENILILVLRKVKISFALGNLKNIVVFPGFLCKYSQEISIVKIGFTITIRD